MLASDLPYDILTNIAEYLSCDDSRECSYSCKAWLTPFRKYGWKSVFINSKSYFEHICSQSSSKTDFSLKANRYFVRSLDIGYHIKVNNEQLHTLQQQFQNIKHFTVTNGVFDSSSFGNTTDWRSWRYLETLEMTAPAMKSIVQFNNVFESLSHLESLSNLSLNGYHNGDVVCTWEDIDRIHEYLPKLRKLELNMDFSPMNINALAKIKESTKPAINITQINFHITRTTALWLFYFTCKYPNIEYFSWGDGFKSDEQYENWELIMPMFFSLDTMFPRLVDIFLNASGSNARSSYSNFWKLINRFKAPLKNVCYSTNWELDTIAEPENTLTECLQACSPTMVTLYYGNNTRPQSVNKAPIEFTMCPRLVDLCLEFFGSRLKLDNILDNCPVLKKLVLKCKLLFLSREATKNSAVPHGLESIVLTRIKTTTTVFSYLSLRCKDLNSMRLKFIKVRGLVSPTTGSLCIDMPFTHFKLLRIVHSTFSLHKHQYDQTNVDDKEHHFSYSPQLINLLTIQYTAPPENHDSPDDVSTETPSEQSVSQLWFHFYLDLSQRIPGSKSQLLTPEEVNYAQMHFESFKERNRILRGSSDQRPGNYCWHPKRSWKNDLVHGRVLLNCRGLDEYHIKGVRTKGCYSESDVSY